jgi:ketosteroid isomerase-like protein
MKIFLCLLLCLGAAAQSRENLEAQLLARDREFNDTVQKQRLQGWMSFFAEDAVVPGGKEGPVVTAKAAIERLYAGMFAQPGFQLSWKPLKAEVSRSGDLGYTYGLYERTNAGPGGKPVRSTGKYCTVWRKGADGSWMVVFDIGN